MKPVSFIRNKKVDADPAIPHTLPPAGPGLTIGTTVVTEETYGQLDNPGTVDGTLVSAVDHTHGTPPFVPNEIITWPSPNTMPAPGVYPPGTFILPTGFPQTVSTMLTGDTVNGSVTVQITSGVVTVDRDANSTATATTIAAGTRVTAVDEPNQRITLNAPATATGTNVPLTLTPPYGRYANFGENGGVRPYYFDPTPDVPGFPPGPRGWRMASAYNHEIAHDMIGPYYSLPGGAAHVLDGVDFSHTPVDCNVQITVSGRITRTSGAGISTAQTSLWRTAAFTGGVIIGVPLVGPLRVVTTSVAESSSAQASMSFSELIPKESPLTYVLVNQALGAGATQYYWDNETAAPGEGWRWHFIIT